jgi:hypothetical protein
LQAGGTGLHRFLIMVPIMMPMFGMVHLEGADDGVESS